MPRRLVSVDDSFNLPTSVKAGDANLPARLQDAALSATYASGAVHFIVSDTAPTQTTVNGKPVVWIDTSVAAAPDTTAPTAPTSLAGTAGATTMNLTWTASTDAVGVTGYRVSKDNGATWITSAVTGTSYQVTGLTASTSYTFAVAARDAAGNWSTNATLTKSTSAPPVAYSTAVIADSPTLYLPLDDAAGTTSPRVLGSGGFTATASNVTFGATGIGDGGTAATFAGTNTSNVATTMPFTASKNVLTFEALIRPTSVSATQRFMGSLNKVFLHVGVDRKFAYLAGSTAIADTPLANAGQTYHVVGVKSATELRLYINGSLAKTVASTTATLTSTTNLYVGGTGDGTAAESKFTGTIAGVAVYDGVELSEARILAHAQAAGVA